MKRVEALQREFVRLYGSAPERVFFAPGRVNLIGEHTDYNGGHVFPAALTFGTLVTVRLREDGRFRLTSLNLRTGWSWKGAMWSTGRKTAGPTSPRG